MGKPVVILADTDERYLSPLELKFLEELEDTIELELITDEYFYDEYFSQPQNVDILVVSQELYTSDIQKQNIDNIFVLTEQPDSGGTEDLAITCIYKYTSIKEIYNQIIAASSGTIKAQTDQNKETMVVLVYSASGGTGKTTLAMGISACLAQSFKKVLYVNAERINTFGSLINNRADMSSSVYSELTTGGPDIFQRIRHVIRNEKFDYLPPLGGALSSLNISFSIYDEIIQSAKLTKEYDVIVVDTDTVFDEDKANLITKANKVLMVLEQSKQSVYAMNTLMKNMSCNDSEKYYFICNNFDETKNNALIDSEEKPRFITNEYVRRIDDIDSLKLSDLCKKPDMQKVAFIVV